MNLTHHEGLRMAGLETALVLLAALVFATLLALGLAYYGASVAVPSWNVHSVPPPRLY